MNPYQLKEKGFKGFVFVLSIMLQPRKASRAIPSERNVLIESSVKGCLSKKNALLLIFVCLLGGGTQAWNQYPGEKKYGNKTELHVMSI